ncbi:hypothetical protein ANN_18539 [Periplaneta americana]|uniref:Uncharacterized protein n=1 Tax=Periplaneta americana TaxID=6978 RepID=A0ABQ8SQD9_PERAM|nr:hypothetical protein ANN_18539 [Periplaneta americana]
MAGLCEVGNEPPGSLKPRMSHLPEHAFTKHRLLGQKNPFLYDEVERNPFHVMVWAVLSATHIFGPFFFQDFVNGPVYQNMLSECFTDVDGRPRMEEEEEEKKKTKKKKKKKKKKKV